MLVKLHSISVLRACNLILLLTVSHRSKDRLNYQSKEDRKISPVCSGWRGVEFEREFKHTGSSSVDRLFWISYPVILLVPQRCWSGSNTAARCQGNYRTFMCVLERGWRQAEFEGCFTLCEPHACSEIRPCNLLVSRRRGGGLHDCSKGHDGLQKSYACTGTSWEPRMGSSASSFETVQRVEGQKCTENVQDV